MDRKGKGARARLRQTWHSHGAFVDALREVLGLEPLSDFKGRAGAKNLQRARAAVEERKAS